MLKPFLAGVLITTVIWMVCLGIMYLDFRREIMNLHQELIQENYKLRKEIVKITKISKGKAQVIITKGGK